VTKPVLDKITRVRTVSPTCLGWPRVRRPCLKQVSEEVVRRCDREIDVWMRVLLPAERIERNLQSEIGWVVDSGAVWFIKGVATLLAPAFLLSLVWLTYYLW